MPQSQNPAVPQSQNPAVPPAPAFDPAGPYRLHPQAELRDEPFGALAYHFGTRRLSFLKAPVLVDVLRALAGSSSVEDALTRCDVPDASRPALLAALAGLARSDMIQPRLDS